MLKTSPDSLFCSAKEAKEIVELVQSSLERNSELRLREKERLDDLVYACFGLTSKKSLGNGS